VEHQGHFVAQYVAEQQSKLSALSTAVMEQQGKQVTVTVDFRLFTHTY